jgi:hypothetical protein
MSNIIRFMISGHGPETDAPSMEDLIDQMRDYLDILRGVEEAAAGVAESAIVWRVVEASRNSPVTFGLAAYPKQYATNIDQRVAIVLRETAQGLATIKNRAERPKYFTNHVMRKARKIAERVTNGIGMTSADFGPGFPTIELTATAARAAMHNVDLVLSGPSKPYQEIGSIEGYFQGVELDGFNRRIAHVRDRITGEHVKCVIPRGPSQLALDIATRPIGEVWNKVRVQVFGRIFYDGPGRIDRVEADGIHFFRPRSELPQIDDVVDDDFTSGLCSEEYLGRLRDGTLPQ